MIKTLFGEIMTKIVINTGSGFDLTHTAVMRYAELKGIKLTGYLFHFNSSYYDNQWYTKYNPENKEERELETFVHYFLNTDSDVIMELNNSIEQFHVYSINRTDTSLIKVVEELQESEQLDLKIVEIPDDVKWEIHEDEMGPECVREVSRCWS